MRSGAKTAPATVVEEREPGIRAGPTGPEKRSGEARAACRGDPPAAAPRARGMERGRTGPRAGPRRPEQARGTVLQGISAEGQKRYWVGQGCQQGTKLTGLKSKDNAGLRQYKGCATLLYLMRKNDKERKGHQMRFGVSADREHDS